MFGGQHENNATYADTWSWTSGVGWVCLIQPYSS